MRLFGLNTWSAILLDIIRDILHSIITAGKMLLTFCLHDKLILFTVIFLVYICRQNAETPCAHPAHTKLISGQDT